MSLPAVILAGGPATRLGPLAQNTPKSLIVVVGQPFIVHQLQLLRRNGITHIVLCVGHLGEQIQATLGDGYAWGVHLYYSFDGPRLLGTGGAIRQALPLLGDSFFVLYGDSYLDCDYQAVRRAFEASGKLALMTVFRNENQWDPSNVIFRDGQIIHYDKRHHTPEMQYLDYGLGLFRAAAFDRYAGQQGFDLADVYADLLAAEQLAAFEVMQRFYEIGSLSGLEETRRFLEARQES